MFSLLNILTIKKPNTAEYTTLDTTVMIKNVGVIDSVIIPDKHAAAFKIGIKEYAILEISTNAGMIPKKTSKPTKGPKYPFASFTDFAKVDKKEEKEIRNKSKDKIMNNK